MGELRVMINREITGDELFAKRNDRIPVVTQEKSTGRILGLNLTNRDAFNKTLETGECHYYDEVNNAVYLKGEHSGEVETILEMHLDSCHARRHELRLQYRGTMAEGKCKFGVTDCHFYVYRDGRFVFDSGCISNPEAVKEFKERIETLLNTEDDRDHQKRFLKL